MTLFVSLEFEGKKVMHVRVVEYISTPRRGSYYTRIASYREAIKNQYVLIPAAV